MDYLHPPMMQDEELFSAYLHPPMALSEEKAGSGSEGGAGSASHGMYVDSYFH